MATAQNLLDAYNSGLYNYDSGPYTFAPTETSNTITLLAGAEEMIRCSTEGFWVRGVKVEQDDKEAEYVYNAFKQWLTWAQLNGQM